MNPISPELISIKTPSPEGSIESILSKKKFEEIWKQSGMEKIYNRMDELQMIGFRFEEGDMDFHESAALDEWIETHCPGQSVHDVDIGRLKKAVPSIKLTAQKNRDIEHIFSSNPSDYTSPQL
jgi:hypothetical protein